MFLGDIVKLKKDARHPNIENDNDFMIKAIEQDWIWLIVGCDEEGIDYSIRPLGYVEESGSWVELGSSLLVLHDELEMYDYKSKDELFLLLNRQRCEEV